MCWRRSASSWQAPPARGRRGRRRLVGESGRGAEVGGQVAAQVGRQRQCGHAWGLGHARHSSPAAPGSLTPGAGQALAAVQVVGARRAHQALVAGGVWHEAGQAGLHRDRHGQLRGAAGVGQRRGGGWLERDLRRGWVGVRGAVRWWRCGAVVAGCAGLLVDGASGQQGPGLRPLSPAAAALHRRARPHLPALASPARRHPHTAAPGRRAPRGRTPGRWCRAAGAV